ERASGGASLRRSLRNLSKENSRVRQAETSTKFARYQIAGCVRRRPRFRMCGCARPGAAMSKHESRPAVALGSRSENLSHERQGSPGPADRRPIMGEIGFIGLGHMGTAM